MNYTLHHGDCLEILRTLPSGSVDAVVTDPPYGLGFPYLSYDDTRDALARLIDGFMPEALRIAKRVFVLCGPTQIGMYPQADWVANVTWNTTGTFGKFGYNQWTPVLCYGKDISGFGNVNGVLKSDTMRISGGGGVGFMRSDEEKKHTCPKPITVMRSVVQRLTTEDATILDPFMGSGTTGVACMQTGRKFIGIEIDAGYVEIARKRIEAAVPLTAEVA
jgi:site-specific DNA-methyltransferase (adenine-specific)